MSFACSGIAHFEILLETFTEKTLTYFFSCGSYIQSLMGGPGDAGALGGAARRSSLPLHFTSAMGWASGRGLRSYPGVRRFPLEEGVRGPPRGHVSLSAGWGGCPACFRGKSGHPRSPPWSCKTPAAAVWPGSRPQGSRTPLVPDKDAEQTKHAPSQERGGRCGGRGERGG